MFYVWLCNSWPGIVINFSTIHFSPVWIQIPFTFGSRQRRTSRCACACLRVSSKRRCSSGWWQTISALESRVSLLYWKASCMHPLTLRPAPGSSKMTKGLFPGKVAFISVFYRTVVVHYINTYNTYKNTYNLYSNVTKRLKRFQILKWNEYYFDTVQGTEVEFLQKKVIICLKGVNVLKISSFLHTESQGVWLRYCVISLWIATLWHVPVKLVTVSLLDLLWDICSWKWAWPRAIQETFHIKSTPVEKVTLPIDWDKLL